MPPEKRDNNGRASGQGQGSRVVNHNSAQRQYTSSSNWEGPPPLPATGIGSSIGQNLSPVFQISTANNEFGMQEIAQPAPGLQAAPYTNNAAYGYAPAPQWPPPGGISESDYIRSVRSYIPPPPIPNRVGQIYGDARDYLPREQQGVLTGVSNLGMSPAMQLDRDPTIPLQRALELSSGLSAGGLQYSRFNSYYPGIANGVAQTQMIPGLNTIPSGPEAGLFPSTARLNHLVSQIPDTTTPRGQVDYDRARASQLSKAQKARKFSDRDSNPPTPSFKRGRLIKDITDQEEVETPSQALVVYNNNPSNNAVSHPSLHDLIAEAGSQSFRPDMTNSTARNSTSFLPDPFMGFTGSGSTVEAPAMAPPRRGIIMADNYNIFNPSLMARVAANCEDGMYRNTPAAIATYHQLGMADDLFYGGIWKGMFKVNGSYIIEYNNPGPHRPEVPEALRNDRHLVMARAQMNGKMYWCSIINGNVLIPVAEAIEDGSADHENTLDLMKYFYTRVPCFPSIDRYAELVAPLHVDQSRESITENEVIVGMAPGSNTSTAALRLATPAEASSAEAVATAALRYIPTVRHQNPPTVAAEAPAVPFAPLNVGMLSNAPATLLPSAGASMNSNVAGFNPGYLGSFPDPGIIPTTSAALPPPINSRWPNPSGYNPFPDLGMVPNAPSASGATFPLVNTHGVQDITGLDLNTLGAYGDQTLTSHHLSTPFDMPSFEYSSTAFNMSGASHPAYPSTSQDLGVIPTSADTIPNVVAHSDVPIATVPTSAYQFPIDNIGTPSAGPDPYLDYVAPSSNPGMTPDTGMAMPAASPGPADGSGGEDLDVMPADFETYIRDSNIIMNNWRTTGRLSPGSISLGQNNGNLDANHIDPTNVGVDTAHIATAPATADNNVVVNGTVDIEELINREDPFGFGGQSIDRIPLGSNVFGSDEDINGVLFLNGAIADEDSDGFTDTQSSELPNGDAEFEEINGIQFG